MNPSMGQSQCARLPLAIIWYHKEKKASPQKPTNSKISEKNEQRKYMRKKSDRSFQRRRQPHRHPLSFFPNSVSFLAFPLPFQCLCHHFTRDTEPESVLCLRCHCVTCPCTFLGLFTDHAAEILPAHECQSHTCYLVVVDGRGRMKGLLEELLGLDGGLCLNRCADEVVSRLDILRGICLAE